MQAWSPYGNHTSGISRANCGNFGSGLKKGTHEASDAMTELKELKKRFMEDPEFRQDYARVDEAYALVEALVSRPDDSEAHAGGGRTAAGDDAVGNRAAGRRTRVTIVRHAAPLRRSDRHATDGGPGAGQQLSGTCRIGFRSCSAG